MSEHDNSISAEAHLRSKLRPGVVCPAGRSQNQSAVLDHLDDVGIDRPVDAETEMSNECL
jgi:hypothetical protein